MRRGRAGGRRRERQKRGAAADRAAAGVRSGGSTPAATGASAASRFYDPGADDDLGSVATLMEEPRQRRPRRRPVVGSPATAAVPVILDGAREGGGRPARAKRRRVLALACLTALALLLGLNGALALRDVVTVGGALERFVPSGTTGVLGLFSDEVRVLRFGFLRRAANAIKGPVRIGLQVGHLGAADQPDELAALRTSTGGHWGGVDEVSVNLAVVEALAERLSALGFEVDVLNATVPIGYRADALVSVHADANPDTARRGYKSAHTRPARNALEPLLKLAVDRRIFLATALPDDDRNVSGNMLQYYAFNHRRFAHAATARTPGLLVELGYLSNQEDMAWLRQPDVFADAIARGLVDFLREIGRL